MKKLIAMLMLLVVVVLAFAGCSPSTCESCGKEGVKTTKVEIEGESGYVCEDCKAIVDLAKALTGAVE